MESVTGVSVLGEMSNIAVLVDSYFAILTGSSVVTVGCGMHDGTLRLAVSAAAAAAAGFVMEPATVFSLISPNTCLLKLSCCSVTEAS